MALKDDACITEKGDILVKVDGAINITQADKAGWPIGPEERDLINDVAARRVQLPLCVEKEEEDSSN